MSSKVKTFPMRNQRQWEAAKVKMLTSGWLANARPIDHDIRYGLKSLRGKARQQAQNNDHVRHFLNLVKTNVVGRQGIVLQGRVKLKNGKPDRRTNEAIEAAWKDWSRRGSPDVTGQLSWRDIQRQFIETVARDGEAIYRKVIGWDGNRYQFALQAIDPELLDVDYNEDLGNGRKVVMGVELDEWRRPQAYYLLIDGIGIDRNPAPRERVRIPADQIYHCYLPEWVFQTRGVPWISTALQRIYMLSGYEDAEITAARVSAAKMGFYQMDLDAALELSSKDGAAGGALGSGTMANGDLAQDVSPGQFEVLPPGYSFHGWDPQHPNAAFGDFVKNALRAMAGGLNISYHKFANDPADVNYSTARIFELDERDAWMLLQDWMIEAFNDRVYRDWLETSVMVGAIGGLQRPLPVERIDDFMQVSWQPRRWPWVDPAKEMDANERAIKLRLTSVSKIMRDQGVDPDEMWQELAADMERLQELNIPISAVAAPVQQEMNLEEEEPDDGED